ncbi:MAG: hypothetical protein ACOWWM_12675 [Desulfobacterales bacterium]
MISPTGQRVRQKDKWGSGAYGARRDGGSRMHRGTDYICHPGQPVVCPIDQALVVREARPYAGGSYSGVLLRAKRIEIKLFYLEPLLDLYGRTVRMGDVIGHAQDISRKYPGIIPHVHLQIESMDCALLCDLHAAVQQLP